MISNEHRSLLMPFEMMMIQALRGPHSLYRRYQGLLESTATAAGFAVLVSLTLKQMAVYPDNWVIVVGVALGLAGIRWPAVAYFAGVAVMVYPVYTINFYLAVLFIAISALGHRLFIHYLGATALVLAAPLLAQYHLHWLVPILGGLWWGGIAGAWVGGLAALWGKVLGGMSGMNIDWLVMAGQMPDSEAITLRFQDANSLNTLLLLVEPFATTSSLMLYHLLQVAGWAMTGAFVGTLAYRKWVKYYAPWSVLVVTAGGGLIMLAAHVGLPYWLIEAKLQINIAVDPVAPLFSLVVVIIVGTIIYSLRESLDLPVAPRQKIRRKPKSRGIVARMQAFGLLRRAARSSNASTDAKLEQELDDLNRPRRPVRVPHQSELPEWEPPKDESGLIMLEID